MKKKLYSHKVAINEKRRTNKKISDFQSKKVEKKAIKEVFNCYYRDQLRALYNAIYNSQWN
jgi:lysine/ornithine N-monooxygenase